MASPSRALTDVAAASPSQGLEPDEGASFGNQAPRKEACPARLIERSANARATQTGPSVSDFPTRQSPGNQTRGIGEAASLSGSSTPNNMTSTENHMRAANSHKQSALGPPPLPDAAFGKPRVSWHPDAPL